jgi:hypothetical protein
MAADQGGLEDHLTNQIIGVLLKVAVENPDDDGDGVDIPLVFVAFNLHFEAEKRKFDLEQQRMRDAALLQSTKIKRRRRQRVLEPGAVRDPLKSAWYKTYVDETMETEAYHDTFGHCAKEFRTMFRVPWNVFVHLMHLLEAEAAFKPSNNALGKPSSPLSLLLLGALSILAATQTFIGLESATLISAQSHRNFFKKFVRWGCKCLYPQYVKRPQTQAEFDALMEPYTALGLPGTLCSIDATHVELHWCSDNEKISATGKSGKPTRAFQIAVNFERKILSTTKGYYGSWNDKTIAKRDTFLKDLRDNKIGKDIKWRLYGCDGVSQERIGFLHAICDGGYPSWGNLLCAKTPTTDPNTLAWNSRIGQVRKDVECTFGILKRRFRIFKDGWRSPSLKMLDDAWFTCCALHNLLLDFDAPDDSSDEEESESAADDDSVDDDYSDLSCDDDAVSGSSEEDDVKENSETVFRESLDVRRRRMIDHFTEIRARGQVRWVSARKHRTKHSL